MSLQDTIQHPLTSESDGMSNCGQVLTDTAHTGIFNHKGVLLGPSPELKSEQERSQPLFSDNLMQRNSKEIKAAYLRGSSAGLASWRTPCGIDVLVLNLCFLRHLLFVSWKVRKGRKQQLPKCRDSPHLHVPKLHIPNQTIFGI